MNSPSLTPINAVIADDEPLLLQALEEELLACMPELNIIERCRSGSQAFKVIQHQPIDVAFLDIQMPGLTGLDVAEQCLEEVAETEKTLPLFVFVTAYSEYAVKAFDIAAVDYIVKPINTDRLTQTVQRIRNRFKQPSNGSISNEATMPNAESLTQLVTQPLALADETDKLQTIKATVGDNTYWIPIDEVVLFTASEKYIDVHTAERCVVIRTTIRDLMLQLEPEKFVRIHRSSIVNRSKLKAVKRLDHHKMCLVLDGIDETPVVSRLYQPLFRSIRLNTS